MRRSKMVGVEAGNRDAVDIYILYAARMTSVVTLVQEFIPATFIEGFPEKKTMYHVYANCSALETESRSTQEDCQEGDDGNNNGND